MVSAHTKEDKIIQPSADVRVSSISTDVHCALFAKLLKNRITPILQQHMSNFQNGGTKGKGVVDNLLILRALFDHAKYLSNELWLTFMILKMF